MDDIDARRVAFASLTVAFGLLLALGYAQAAASGGEIRGNDSVEQAFLTGETGPVVSPADGVTVVGTDSTAFVSDEGSGPRERAELAAFDADGRIFYYDDSHTRYWDVDPVPGTKWTVEYAYADHLDADECNADTVCTRNGVERVNLSTGDRSHVYSRVTPGKHSTRWHDVDRIDEHRLLVGDIDRDRAYVVNTSTGLVDWEWDAQANYDTESGGPYPDDWTHINDVEHVEIDGREAVMISLRNHDQVVFVDVERGLREDWTLGAEDDYDVLYEQHNPDFIPESQGGPAVLVADSENGRVVEYQREDGGWKRTWTWSDERLQWPRDADRLPNGNTLVTDSNGDRVIEVAPNGSVVWTAELGFPYEAERLETGDESGGESAATLGLASREPSADSGGERLLQSVIGFLPKQVVNGILYVLPAWVGGVELLAILGLLVIVPTWARHEWRRSERTIRPRWPVEVGRR